MKGIHSINCVHFYIQLIYSSIQLFQGVWTEIEHSNLLQLCFKYETKDINIDCESLFINMICYMFGIHNYLCHACVRESIRIFSKVPFSNIYIML